MKITIDTSEFRDEELTDIISTLRFNKARNILSLEGERLYMHLDRERQIRNKLPVGNPATAIKERYWGTEERNQSIQHVIAESKYNRKDKGNE